MREFKREDPLFSLCGLNCGLCSMKLGGNCPGCGCGNRPCRAGRCAMERGVAYCFQCGEYPCAIYDHAGEKDSFITHLHQKADMDKARRIGLAAYHAEQEEKAALLSRLLSAYNDGRRKTLYCLAVNLLEAEDIRRAIGTVEDEADMREAPQQAQAERIAAALRAIAGEKGVALKLRK